MNIIFCHYQLVERAGFEPARNCFITFTQFLAIAVILAYTSTYSVISPKYQLIVRVKVIFSSITS